MVHPQSYRVSAAFRKPNEGSFMAGTMSTPARTAPPHVTGQVSSDPHAQTARFAARLEKTGLPTRNIAARP
jgi:hypothetical protein